MSICTWNTNRHQLILQLKLNWPIYQLSNLVLPPPSLGKCTNWRFEISKDQLTAVFIAYWDKRRGDYSQKVRDILEIDIRRDFFNVFDISIPVV
jgi:hypothetical protein